MSLLRSIQQYSLLTVIGLMVIGMASSTSLAQQTDQSTETSAVLEEITVTATKRESGLQDTPITILAFSAETVSAQRIHNLQDLETKAPTLGITSLAPWQSLLSIRGSFSSSSSPGTDQPNAVFIDEVYRDKAHDLSFDMYDIERIEVLRGPQGTLFGRNVSGGLISVITRVPTAEPYRAFDFSYGNAGAIRVGGAVSGQVAENVFASLSAVSSTRDGLTDNVVTGRDDGRLDSRSLRAKLRWQPSDGLDVQITADFRDDTSDGTVLHALMDAPLLFPMVPVRDIDRQSAYDVTPIDLETQGMTARVEYSLPNWSDVTLTSITSKRSLDLHVPNTEFLGVPTDILKIARTDEDDNTSQELRLAGSTEKVDWVAGVYYWHSKGFRNKVTIIKPHPATGLGFFGVPNTMTDEDQWVTTDSIAAFGQATFNVNDHWRATLGLRHTKDERDGRSTRTGLVMGFIPMPSYDVTYSGKWSETIPKVTLEYLADSGLMTFLTYSRGYRAGGFPVNQDNAVESAQAFNPEFTKNYEVGMKGEWLENTLRASATMFRMEYSDLQLSSVRTTTAGPQRWIENAGQAHVKGIELEIAARPSAAFELGLNYAYMSSNFDDFISGDIDYTGETLPNTPEHSASLNVAYNWQLDEADLTTRIGMQYRSESKNFYDQVHPEVNKLTERKLIDASINYTRGNWTTSLWGKNLTDELVAISYLDITPFVMTFAPEMVTGAAYVSSPILPGRTFGISLSYRMN